MVQKYYRVARIALGLTMIAVMAVPLLMSFDAADAVPGTPSASSVAPQEIKKSTYGLDKITLTGAGTTDWTVIDIAGQIINWFLGFLGIIAVILVLISGFQWMTADSEDKVKEAQKRLFNSVIGLAIVALAWVIGYAIINSMTTILGGQPPTPVP